MAARDASRTQGTAAARPLTSHPAPPFFLQASEAVPLSQRSIDVNCDRVLTGHTGPLTAMTYLPDAALLVSAAADCTIRFWDASRTHSPRRVRLPSPLTSHHTPLLPPLKVLGRDGDADPADGARRRLARPPRSR